MKFLYFGDRHNTFKNPENRLDDYQETCRKKDEEIIKIGKDNQIAAFLHPGDFWNENEVKGENDFINLIIKRWGLINSNKIISSIKNSNTINPDLLKLINNYIPLIGIVGNHDLIGNSLDTLPKTTTGLLASLGQMNLVTKENPIFFTTEDGLKIAITGTHYHLNMDDPEYIDDYIVTEKLGDYHIHIVHGMLSDKDMGPLIKHTKIDDIKNTQADITLCGHNHIGFGVIKTNDKYFINIGSVTRISNDIKEISRMPEVALIDISKKGIFINEIPLKTALPGIEILDRTETEANLKKQKSINEFKKEIKTLKDSKKSVNIIDFVSDVAKAKGISEEVKNDILDRLTKKELETAKTKYEINDAYISKIILENFQSHEYSEFDLSNGFNVFVGESRQGKSAIQRALYWVYENKPSGKNIIQRGKPYAKVTIYLSNNTVVSRYIESKKSGKNTYEIIYPDGTISSGNTKLLEQVQRVLGFNYFKIDSKLSLPVNFYKQGESWYLIGDKLSSTDKARVIGALNGTNLADDIIRDLDSENSKILTLNKVSQKKCEEIQTEIESLDNLDNLEEIIKKNNELLNKYKLIKEKKENIEKFYKNYNNSYNSFIQNKSILNKLKNIEKINSNLMKLKDITYLYNNIYKEKIKYDDFLVKFNNNSLLLNKLNVIDNIKENTINLKNKKELYEKIKKNYEYYKTNIELLNNNNKILKKTKNIKQTKIIIDNLKEKNNILINISDKVQNININNKELDKIQNTLSKIKETEKIKDSIIEYNEILEKENILKDKFSDYLIKRKNMKKEELKRIDLDKKVSYQKQQYEKILKESDICPICKRPLDKHTIENIIK